MSFIIVKDSKATIFVGKFKIDHPIKPLVMSQLEFTAHFSQLQGVLHAFAIRLTQDEREAQDLVQETAYKAYKYRNMYQPKTNLRAWLMTIMRNTFINNYRQRKRRQTIYDHSDNDFLLNTGDNAVQNSAPGAITFDELYQAVEQLEDWVRIPFLMHYQGFKYEEIAQELQIPLGTVKSRIFFARKKLQDAVRHLYKNTSVADLVD
jgi:RNA polymerase sigma-70 factor (ECF subfamily)